MDTKRIVKKIPQGMKASVALFFATVVTKGIAYLTTPLYTRLLTAEEYGQTSLFYTWFHLLGIVAMFCLSYGVFNNGMLEYPESRDEYSFSMLILSNLITFCICGILLCLYPLLRQWIRLDWKLMLLMGVIFLFQPAYNFWTNRQRYELKYKATFFWTIFSALLSPLVAIISIWFSETGKIYARIFGAELTLVIIYVGFYIYLAVKAKWKIERRYWKFAFWFNLPLIPHYISANLLSSSDKLMISKLVGDVATAYYSVAYSIASVASIIWNAVNASLIPYTYERCKKNDHDAISNITMPILTVMAFLCVMVIMLAPEAVSFMATADYEEAIYVIPPVVGGVFFQVQYFIYANIVYYYKRPKYVMYASVVSAGMNILFNYIFIHRCGFIAAGYTTLFCYLLQAMIDYFAMKRVVGKSVYDMKYLGILSLFMLCISLGSNWIYKYWTIRYIIIFVLLVVIFIYRKKIVTRLKWLKE